MEVLNGKIAIFHLQKAKMLFQVLSSFNLGLKIHGFIANRNVIPVSKSVAENAMVPY